MMDGRPIIERIESQKCIGYRDYIGGGFISIIENVGVDKGGQHWKWISENLTKYREDGFGYGCHYQDYGYTRISPPAPTG